MKLKMVALIVLLPCVALGQSRENCRVIETTRGTFYDVFGRNMSRPAAIEEKRKFEDIETFLQNDPVGRSRTRERRTYRIDCNF